MSKVISINLGADGVRFAVIREADEGVTALTLDLAGEWGIENEVHAQVELAYGPLGSPYGYLVTACDDSAEFRVQPKWVGDYQDAVSVAASMVADLVHRLVDAEEDATGGWADPRPECEQTQLGAITGTEDDDCDDCDGDDLAPLKMGA